MSLISSKLTAPERIALKNKIIMGVLKKEKNKTEEQGETYTNRITKSVFVEPTDRYYNGNYPINHSLS